jgi:dinuclear metal center YbgI/SA1388 family protein
VATVADIVKIMETIAPPWLAEKWDNVGLQIGQKEWSVKTVWIALDPSFDVVHDACSHGVDLLITHHPLIFQPLTSINFDTGVGSIIQLAIKHQMAIYSAHTNLDSATDGLNDVLANRIGLKNLRVLGESKGAGIYKLVIYVPLKYEQGVLKSIFETSAGEMGSYTCCTFRSSGKGTFKPGSSAQPFTGQIDETATVDEIRIETVVQKKDLNYVIEHIKKKHPYETMAYDIYPLVPFGNQQGLGRIGELDERMDLASFALSLKKKLGLSEVKIAGNIDLPVTLVALCAGSGSSLMDEFLSSGAHVYVSGDLRYHDARSVEAAELGLIDIGHFASEHLFIEVFRDRLCVLLSEIGIHVKVEAYGLENDPFVRL